MDVEVLIVCKSYFNEKSKINVLMIFFSSGTFAWDFPAMVEVSLSAADAVLLVFSHVNPLSPLSTHLTNAL